MVGIAQVEVPEGAKKAIRNELEIASGRNILQPCGIAFLIQAAFDATGDSRPEGALVVTLDVPVQQDSPGLRIVRGKPQAAKRNRHPDHEAFFRDLSLGAEDGVEREIKLLAFGPESVCLDSQGIGKKGIGPAVIVERVQHQLDIVIVKHFFPPRKIGANLMRLIVEADEDDVQVLVVISQVGLGALR